MRLFIILAVGYIVRFLIFTSTEQRKTRLKDFLMRHSIRNILCITAWFLGIMTWNCLENSENIEGAKNSYLAGAICLLLVRVTPRLIGESHLQTWPILINVPIIICRRLRGRWNQCKSYYLVSSSPFQSLNSSIIFSNTWFKYARRIKHAGAEKWICILLRTPELPEVPSSVCGKLIDINNNNKRSILGKAGCARPLT